MRDCLGDDLRQWRPSDRRHGGDHLVLHQVDRLAEEKNPDLMPGLRKGVGMEKSKGGFCRVVRSPCAFNQDFHAGVSLSKESGCLYDGSPVVADRAIKHGLPTVSVAMQQSFRYLLCLLFRQVTRLHNP